MKKKVSFPHIGNYYVPIKYLFERGLDVEYLVPPPITKKTLEIGGLNSPDFVCSPFKYNLGNYIESLEQGADILIQVGGVCRLGYYGELHEQILKDLNYKFKFVNLSTINYKKPYAFYQELKKINPKFSIKKAAEVILIFIKMIEVIDKVEEYIRENIGFEVENGAFDKIHQEFLDKILTVNSKKEVKEIYSEYMKKFKSIKTNKPKKPLRVGVIGEYYTIMEPFSNHFLEKELAKKGIVVTRSMNASNSLLFRKEPEILNKIKGYIKYNIGATGMDTVKEAIVLAKGGYDGLIHVKSFGCTPEIDAISILNNVSNDYKIPIIYFSFDLQTSEVGIKTRLEAFYDMIVMRKEKK